MKNEFTAELIEKAKTAKTSEELLAIAKDNGTELTEEQAKDYYEQLNKSGELSDDELDNVAGGGCGDSDIDEAFIKAGKEGSLCPVCGDAIVTRTYSDIQYYKNCYETIYECSACGKTLMNRGEGNW